MKADKYRFDGARTCDLRGLSCDGNEQRRNPAKNCRKAAKDDRIGG